jgi:DNA-directed RNA polymerase subunit RPC12/RpoP
MLLKCKCPKCGEKKEYIAEQVGSPLDCFRCGHRFILKNNTARATWRVVTATVAVLAFFGALAAWYYESRRWESFEVREEQAESYLFGGRHGP